MRINEVIKVKKNIGGEFLGLRVMLKCYQYTIFVNNVRPLVIALLNVKNKVTSNANMIAVYDVGDLTYDFCQYL